MSFDLTSKRDVCFTSILCIRFLISEFPLNSSQTLGTGRFEEIKVPPRVGWDGIVAQILDSATDAEQVHHAMEVRRLGVILQQNTSLSFFKLTFTLFLFPRTCLEKEQMHSTLEQRCLRQNTFASTH